MNLDQFASDVFLTSVKALHLDEVMRQYVSREDHVIQVGKQTFNIDEFKTVFIIAIGKASNVMLENMLRILQPALGANQDIKAILVSPNLMAPDARVQQFQGEHPLPGRTSLQAAQATLKLLETADERSLVFFLISGGASSMVEQPLNPHWSSDEVASFYRALVHSGLTIAMMNTLRKHASRTKGGRLALAAAPATQCTLLISDVPDNLIDLIGSGPSLPDSSTIADCRDILASHSGKIHLSQRLSNFFYDAKLEETPKADHPAFRRSSWHVLLSNRDLVQRASREARARGFFVEVDNSCDDWDYRDAAPYLLKKLAELRQTHDRVCLLTGGELSVKLASHPGTGGRNQQFVLECARLLAQSSIKATVLSAGSDGVDGNSIAAGAVADETTFSRASVLGIDALAALEKFDSYPVFKALGDDLFIGPTGNNLRDLRILLGVQ